MFSPTILPALIGIYVFHWLSGLFQVAAWTVFFSAVAIGAAFAQDASAQGVSVLAPLLNELISIAVVAVSGGVLWIIRRLSKVLKLESDEQVRKYLLPIIDRSLDGAVAQMRQRVGSLRLPEFKSELLNDALEQVVIAAPGALKHFQVSDQRIREILERKLGVKYPEMITEPAFVPDPNEDRIEGSSLMSGEASRLSSHETT